LDTLTYSGQNFVAFPLEYFRNVGVCKERTSKLTNGEIIVEEFQTM